MMKVDALVVEGAILIGAVLYLSRIVWHQRRAIEALQADRLAIENRLGTIQQQTCFDALTGLRNQQMFEIRVSSLLRGTAPFVLIYIDLDGLKAINDRLGHPSGDALIRSAVKAIRSAVNRLHDLDTLFRRGRAADEFLWILEGSRIDIGTQRAQEILTQLQLVGVSASIGVMEWDASPVATCVAAIELAAEQQMQRAKRAGGNRVCAQAVAEHIVPAALPSNTESVPKAIPNEVTESVPEAIPNEVTESVPEAIPNEVPESVNDTERVEVTERHAA
jgi:diguanylate cyclase (GGDEF)-like protein